MMVLLHPNVPMTFSEYVSRAFARLKSMLARDADSSRESFAPVPTSRISSPPSDAWTSFTPVPSAVHGNTAFTNPLFDIQSEEQEEDACVASIRPCQHNPPKAADSTQPGGVQKSSPADSKANKGQRCQSAGDLTVRPCANDQQAETTDVQEPSTPNREEVPLSLMVWLSHGKRMYSNPAYMRKTNGSIPAGRCMMTPSRPAASARATRGSALPFCLVSPKVTASEHARKLISRPAAHVTASILHCSSFNPPSTRRIASKPTSRPASKPAPHARTTRLTPPRPQEQGPGYLRPTLSSLQKSKIKSVA